MSKEAMKLALEALVQALPDMPVHTDWHLEAITALREALAEQPAQQEPVAWRHDMGEENGGWEYFEEASCPECQPLYTSPPAQRTWVGLTDEEIKRMAAPLFMSHYWNLCNEFARAIEAKLREKNA